MSKRAPILAVFLALVVFLAVALDARQSTPPPVRTHAWYLTPVATPVPERWRFETFDTPEKARAFLERLGPGFSGRAKVAGCGPFVVWYEHADTVYGRASR
jgi:hypothetical protein